MTFFDMLMGLARGQQNIACRDNLKVWGLSRTGFLVSFKDGKQRYAMVQLTDILADTWEILTPEQQAALTAQSEQAG